jgi:DNA-binding PadR family transcriptional regulator
MRPLKRSTRFALAAGVRQPPAHHPVPDRSDQAFYGGLIRLHVLHHAARGPVFGLWLIEELQRHGYRIGPGTLYPILHALERRGLLRSRTRREGRAVRRMYAATREGRRTLERAKGRVRELFAEIFEEGKGRRR